MSMSNFVLTTDQIMRGCLGVDLKLDRECSRPEIGYLWEKKEMDMYTITHVHNTDVLGGHGNPEKPEEINDKYSVQMYASKDE